MKKIISCLICFTLFFQQSGFCQMLDLSGLITRTQFVPDIRIRPPHLRSFGFEPGSSFIVQVDKGDGDQPKEMKEVTQELMKYFLIGLTLPDTAFWVNLRPDSPDNVIDPELARTEIGKIFLEADLELKKDVARYTSPQTDAGRKYWNQLYEKAEQIYGSSSIEFPTTTRPWIVPGEIILGDMGNSAFIYKANLNVMLEADYLKNTASSPRFNDPRAVALNEYSSELIKKLIMPLIIKDVNTAKRYASLRQVYYSLILAQWYKEKFNSAQTPFSSRINSRDLSGLTSPKPADVSRYFSAYARSYANGEYSIKESVATGFGMQVRTYVSGGIKMDGGSFRTTVTSSLKKIIFYPFTRIFKGTDEQFMEELQPAEYTPSPRWASGSMAVTLLQQAQGLERMDYVWPAMTRVEGKELVDFYWRGSKRTHNIVWQDLTTSSVKALIEHQPPEYLSKMIQVEDLGILRLLPKKMLVEMALASLINTKDVAVDFYMRKPLTTAAAGVLGLGLVLTGMHWWDQGHHSSLAVNDTNPVVTQAIASAALDTVNIATVTPDFTLLAATDLPTLEAKLKETSTTAIPTPNPTLTSTVTTKIASVSQPGSDYSSPVVISEVTLTPTPTLTVDPTPTPWANDQTWSQVTDAQGTHSYKIGLNSTVISVQESIISAKLPLDTSLNLATGVITEIPYTTGELKTVTYQPGSAGYADRLKRIENVISDGLEVGIRDNKFETQSELFNAVQAQRFLDNTIGWIEVSTSMSYYHVMPATSHISTVTAAASAHPPLYTSLDRSTGVIVQIPYTTGELQAVSYQPGTQEHTNALQGMSYVVNGELTAGLFGNQLDAQELSKLIAAQNELQKLSGSTFVTYNNGNSHVTVDENYIAYYASDLYTFMNPLTGAITEIRFNMDTKAFEEAGYYEIKDGQKWETAFNRIDYIFREFSFFSPEKLGGQDKLDLVSSARKILSKFDPNPQPTPTPWVNDQTWSQVTDAQGTHSYKIGLNSTVISVQESIISAKLPLDTSLNLATGVITEIPYTTGELKTVIYKPGDEGYADRLKWIENVISDGLEVGIRDNKFETQSELFNAVQAQRFVDGVIGWIEASTSMSYYRVMPGASHISTVMAAASAHPPLYTSLDRSTGVIIQIPYTTGELKAAVLQPGSAEYSWPIEHMLSTIDNAIDLGTGLPAAQIQELKDTKAALLKWQVTPTPTSAELTATPTLTIEPTSTTAEPTIAKKYNMTTKEKSSKDGGETDPLGGIDLRRPLPTTTILPAQLLAKIAQLPTSVTDIEGEWAKIEEYANAGIQPSQERLREFLIACCKQGVITDYSEKMLICLAKVLRAEEKDVVATSPELRNLLMIVQAN